MGEGLDEGYHGQLGRHSRREGLKMLYVDRTLRSLVLVAVDKRSAKLAPAQPFPTLHPRREVRETVEDRGAGLLGVSPLVGV